MKRLPLLLLVTLLLVSLGLLLWRAIDAVRSEERTRQTVIAERVFDELERTLQARLSMEEDRPFLHYNNAFAVDNDLGLLVTKTSPLVHASSDPSLVGYFQRSPSGSLSNPYRRADGSAALDPSSLEPVESEIARALAAVPARSQQPKAPVEVEQQAGPPILQILNKGLQNRDRGASLQTANLGQLGNFIDPSASHPDPRRTDVEVQPFTVDVGDRWIVFRRRVLADGETWVQGFVVHRSPFLKGVAEEALGDLPGAAITWERGPGAFDHRFLPPFEDLQAGLSLAPLPGLRSTRVIVGLALLLLLATLASIALAWRWVQESEDLARQRSDFVAAVTHELRTPLTSIQMYAEMLEQGMAPPSSQGEYLATIRTEAGRLGTLVESVLILAALEREGTVDLGQREGLGSIVEAVVRVLQPIADAHHVELTCTIEASSCSVPKQAMEQVAHNLVENAIKFAVPPRQVRLRVHGRVLEVWNSAPPLPPGLLRRMFEPFVRGESELTRRTNGTGIGLALVRGLVQQLEGQIEARNGEGGIVFSVTLPKAILDNR